MNDKLVVGIADMKMAQGSGMLVTYALGSCIGICFYDPMLKLAARPDAADLPERIQFQAAEFIKIFHVFSLPIRLSGC